ncbi:MAG: hypothetical protein ABL307_03690 [Roseitalea porphyridii]|uniref:hypothetical protein n=2 Tax=Roseitalea porphyridii TaxID=1852022 RepID=UPI0032D93B6B
METHMRNTLSLAMAAAIAIPLGIGAIAVAPCTATAGIFCDVCKAQGCKCDGEKCYDCDDALTTDPGNENGSRTPKFGLKSSLSAPAAQPGQFTR